MNDKEVKETLIILECLINIRMGLNQNDKNSVKLHYTELKDLMKKYLKE